MPHISGQNVAQNVAQDAAQDAAREAVQAQLTSNARYKSALHAHRHGLYSKALEAYRELQKDDKSAGGNQDSLLLRRIAECEYGIQQQSQPEPVTVTKLGININDPRYPSLSAFAVDGEQTLYFTSFRPTASKGKSRRSSEKILDNVCIARRSSATDPWGVASVVAEVGSSQFHQGVLGITPDEKDMFIFRGTNDILVRSLDRTTAREAKPTSIAKALDLNIDKRFHISSLAITGDRQTIYLCTDDGKAKGGYGRCDIWSITRDKLTNEWGEMVNMGPAINTAGDELSVSVLPDGKTIFFASDGHRGVGRCDIYRSTYVDSLGAWGKPVHLGYPINTPTDDIYYNPVFNNPNHAYYSVEKQDVPGVYDIYFIDYQGEILSPEEKEARRKAAEAAAKAAKQQEYKLALQQIVAPVKSTEAQLIAQKGYSEFPQDTAVVGMKVLLRNIQFGKGKATLLPESDKYLEPLYQLMEMQPNIRIRISGHTDNTGKKAANLILSKERAHSVANFLINKGIDPNRITVEGHGQNRPITTNKTEAGRNLNRRVEFTVIK